MLSAQQSPLISPPGAVLKRVREAAGLSRTKAAALVHMSPRLLERYEQGRSRMPVDRWAFLRQQLTGVRAERLVREQITEAVGRLRGQTGSLDSGNPSQDSADAQHRVDIFRAALATCEPRPTLRDLAEWTGFSAQTLRSWRRHPGSQHHRSMSKPALRLVLHEIADHVPNSSARTLLLSA